jgi:hypothetical protein
MSYIDTLRKIARGEAVDTSTRTVPELIRLGYVVLEAGTLTLTHTGWNIIYNNY